MKTPYLTADPTLAQLLAALQQQWRQLATTPVLRAARVAALVGAGWSRRALSRALGVDEGTIRRDLKIARLPAEQKAAIQHGASLAAGLRAAAAGRRAAEASLTEQYADLIVAWVERRQIWPACAEQLLKEADWRLWRLGRPPSKLSVPPAPGLHAQIIAGCRPRAPMPSELEELVDWLVRWARRVMPDPDVREKAFHLAACKIRETALQRSLLAGPGDQRFLRWLRER